MNTTRRDVIIGRVCAAGAALSYGTSAVLVRKGLGVLAPPLVGATIAMFSATLILAMMGARSPEGNLRQKRKPVVLLAITGVFGGLGIAFSYLALSLAPVVMVNPFISTSPLFALLLSHFFLGRLERITLRIVLGTFLVAAGAVLITIGGRA